MYGVNMQAKEAQAYYDSLFELYAEWGVDYIKADDILTDYPGPYHADEVEAIRKAIDKCGRPMVLSLSPGPAPVKQKDHLTANANLWRMSADFWDRWEKLYEMFYLCNAWTGVGGPVHWPDADMLPLGSIALCGPEGPPRDSLFTADEQRTMLSLWSVFRSPLMMGGDLPTSDSATFDLLTNPEVLAVNQHGENPYQLYRHGPLVAWVSDVPGSRDRYLAMFNLADHPQLVPVEFSQLERGSRLQFRDLWERMDMGVIEKRFAEILPPHGSRLFRISPVQ